MRGCGSTGRLIDDLVDGRLSAEGEARLREHCAECRECASRLANAEAFVAEMTASFRAARPAGSGSAARGVERIIAALPEGSPPRPILRIPRIAWLGAAAASAAAVVAISVVTRPGDTGGAPGANGVLAEPSPPREKVGRVVAGSVEVLPEGGTGQAALAARQELFAGDTLRIAAGEPAEVVLEDRARVFLDVGSEAVVLPGTARKGGVDGLRLVRGRLFAEVEKDAGGFVVTTSQGDVRTLGTKFGVSLEPTDRGESELAVVVEEGAVRVDREGAQEIVRAGNACVLRRGSPPCWERGEGCRARLRWAARCRARCRWRGGASEAADGDGMDRPRGAGGRGHGGAGRGGRSRGGRHGRRERRGHGAP
ncbi:MAG: FecR domain-containing protein [Planctomycetota bacterium]|jgi:ferric-dicitrate binding protein FerR (iron transport regulator)